MVDYIPFRISVIPTWYFNNCQHDFNALRHIIPIPNINRQREFAAEPENRFAHCPGRTPDCPANSVGNGCQHFPPKNFRTRVSSRGPDVTHEPIRGKRVASAPVYAGNSRIAPQFNPDAATMSQSE